MKFGIFKIACHSSGDFWFARVEVKNAVFFTTGSHKQKNDAFHEAVCWLSGVLGDTKEALDAPLFKEKEKVHAIRWFGEKIEGIHFRNRFAVGVNGITYDADYFVFFGQRINKGDWIVFMDGYEQGLVMTSKQFAERFTI